MNKRPYIYIFIFVLGFLFCTSVTKGQTKYAPNNVDTAAIQKRINNEYARRDSIIAAAKQKRIDDSIARVIQKQKIQEYRDSLVNARNAKRAADSIARVQAKLKLENDKRIKDSTDAALKKRTQDSLAIQLAKQDSIRNEQKRISDSIAFERKRVADSTMLARKVYDDSIKLVRQNEQRKKAELVKYQNSKQYKDSVEARKAFVKDSIKNARDAQLNVVKTERQRVNDSLKNARQLYNDSLTAVRTKYNDSVSTAQKNLIEKNKSERQRLNDSLLAVRTQRKDSLDAVRKKNQKETATTKEKTNAEKQKSLAIKVHEKKKEEWSNDKLLKRKWNMPRRIYQNTVTRYNYYYNAKRKYDEAIKTITKNHKEDFDKVINIDPYDIQKQGGSIASFMDTVIKKASFSTQIHDPRSKWFDNLFFLMGKASFAKNDFDGAITTFQFIANEYIDAPKKTDKKFSEKDEVSIATLENRKGIKRFRHHPIRNDALIWLAKSYIQAEQYSEAQSLLGTLAKDKNFPDRKKSELFLTKASLEMQQGNKSDVIESLTQALKQELPSKQKTRIEFLLGQLYAENGEYAKSSEHFKKSISKKASPEMDFFTKLSIAENAAKGGGDKAYAVAQLEKIISDPKYAKNKSQALNTLAAIEEEQNTTRSIELLRKSIDNPENKDTKQKALAFAQLGNIYYKSSNYEGAKVSYDSASFYGTTPPLENINEINIRKTVLGEIVSYIRIIRMQDSMLVLAKKSEKEQKAAAKRELDKIKKEQATSQAANNNTQVVALQPNNATKSNWYFYNSTLIQKGSTEFKQKWGNRKLEDNWRRVAATNSSFVSGDKQEGDEEGSEEQTDKMNVGGNTVASLISKLPKTPAEIDIATNKIMDAYYNLGLTYFSQLQDYKHSIDMFDTLLYRFPNTSYKKQCYYGLYINHDKLGNTVQATKYKKLLNDEYTNTEFAKLASDPNYKKEQEKVANSIFEHYDITYSTYKEGKFQEAIDRTAYAHSTYQSNPILAKYDIVEAISYAGISQNEKCKTLLQQVIQNYPNTAEQMHAQNILSYMSQMVAGDTANASNNNLNDLLSVNEGNNKYQDSLEASNIFKELRAVDGKGLYILDLESDHKVMVFVKNVDGRTMGLKSALSDYNLLKHNVKEYTTGMNLLTSQQALITIEKFSNAIFAKKYAQDMSNEKLLFSQLKKNEYDVAIISFVNYIELIKTRDILGYIRFYKKNYK